MKILIHAGNCGPLSDSAKIEWVAIDGADISEQGELDQDSPNFTYEFIMFLLEVGRAELLIGCHIEKRVRKIGEMMKQTGMFQFRLDRNTKEKIPQLDLNGIVDNPTDMQDAISKFFSYEAQTNSHPMQNKILPQ